MNKIIPFFLDKIMPFKVYLVHKLKLTHGAPKTRLLQLINKKKCLFSFHLGISIYKLKQKTLSYLCHVGFLAMPSARHVLYL